VKPTHPDIPPCRIASVNIARNQPVRRKLVIGVASLLITAGALAGCSANAESSMTAPTATTSAPAGPVINLSSLMFNPSTTTMKVGTTVTWRNDEPITHTVTSGRFEGVDKSTGLRSSQNPDGTFNAKLAGKGKTFSFTFTQPGTYTYYCDIHQGMNATITVVADTASP
jgi:plastocyanin